MEVMIMLFLYEYALLFTDGSLELDNPRKNTGTEGLLSVWERMDRRPMDVVRLCKTIGLVIFLTIEGL